MRWIYLTCVGLGLVVGCSDDGVPAENDADTSAAGDVTEGDEAGTSGAVTTTSGGSPTGGESTGGEDSGDAETGSDTDPTGGGPMCVDARQCVVVDDCCTCDAIHVDEEPPQCEITECLVSACTELGLPSPAAACVAGACELAKIACDPDTVTCDALPPLCEAGELPSVAGGCWTGECVPAQHCDVVPSCDACPDGYACVADVALEVQLHCEAVPPACDGTPSCACMGDVCSEPFTACGEPGPEGAELACACPSC